MIGPDIISRHTRQGPVPIDSASVAKMVGWLNDPSVVRYSEQRHRKHTIASQGEYLEQTITSHGNYPSHISAIFRNETFIGTITCHYDIPNSIGNLGIMIGDHNYRGKGFGFEAWNDLCSYLLLMKKVRKIEAGCMSANKAMMKICSKSGMIEEGNREAHFHLTADTYSDLMLWGRTL